MSEQKSQASDGIGVFGLLGILFVGLELTGIIDWSWLALILVVIIVILVLAVAATLLEALEHSRRNSK